MGMFEDAMKVHKVITSCKTADQFNSARKMIDLFYTKWINDGSKGFTPVLIATREMSSYANGVEVGLNLVKTN